MGLVKRGNHISNLASPSITISRLRNDAGAGAGSSVRIRFARARNDAGAGVGAGTRSGTDAGAGVGARPRSGTGAEAGVDARTRSETGARGGTRRTFTGVARIRSGTGARGGTRRTYTESMYMRQQLAHAQARSLVASIAESQMFPDGMPPFSPGRRMMRPGLQIGLSDYVVGRGEQGGHDGGGQVQEDGLHAGEHSGDDDDSEDSDDSDSDEDERRAEEHHGRSREAGEGDQVEEEARHSQE